MSSVDLAFMKKHAKRCQSLSRTPRSPSGGGMQTGDMIEVGIADWHNFVRLAKMVSTYEPIEPTREALWQRLWNIAGKKWWYHECSALKNLNPVILSDDAFCQVADAIKKLNIEEYT